MPTGDNPNSRKNLTKLTTEEARRRGRNGGKKSAEARKAYKTLTEALKAQCTPEVLEKMTSTVIKRAEQGNLKAYELVRDQLGEKPVEKITVAQVDGGTISEIEALIDGVNNTSGKDC